MSKFTIEKCYGEMARMCALILNVIAGDVHDGMTSVHRYHEGRPLTQDEANLILHETHEFKVTSNITKALHEQNIDFFIKQLKAICACPPNNILTAYIYEDLNDFFSEFEEFYEN